MYHLQIGNHFGLRLVEVLLEVHVGYYRFEQHFEVVQGDLCAIFVSEIEEPVEDDGLVLNTALVKEHDHQAEEVSHEDYTVEYLGVNAIALIYLIRLFLRNIVDVLLASNIRYVEEGRVLHDAEDEPRADDACAFILKVSIITGVSNPIYKPDQDEKAYPVYYIEADTICHSKRPDTVIGAFACHVNDVDEVIPV